MLRFRPRALSLAALVLPCCFTPAIHAVAGSASAPQESVLDASGHLLAGAVVRMASDPATHSSHPWRYTLLGDMLGFWVSDGAFAMKRRLGMG